MNNLRLVLVAALVLFTSLGCGRSAKNPPAGFRLERQQVASGTSTYAALLTLHTDTPGWISVETQGRYSSIALQQIGQDGPFQGSVAVVASRITPGQDGNAYIQTLIRPQNPNGSYAGGPSIDTVPRETRLADFFTLTAASGDYALNTPVEIGRLHGNPVILTVGKPVK